MLFLCDSVHTHLFSFAGMKWFATACQKSRKAIACLSLQEGEGGAMSRIVREGWIKQRLVY